MTESEYLERIVIYTKRKEWLRENILDSHRKAKAMVCLFADYLVESSHADPYYRFGEWWEEKELFKRWHTYCEELFGCYGWECDSSCFRNGFRLTKIGRYPATIGYPSEWSRG